MAESKIIPGQEVPAKGNENSDKNQEKIQFISDSKLFGKLEVQGSPEKVKLVLTKFYWMALLNRIALPILLFIGILTMYLCFGDRIFPLIECAIEQIRT